MKKVPWTLLMVGAAWMLAAGCRRDERTPTPRKAAAADATAADATASAPGEGAGDAASEVPPERKAKLQFYIMSQCPFGVEVLDGIIPALRKIGPWVDFQLDFIGKIEGDKLASMHGENEVQGDIVELCTMRHAPGQWMDLFACWNKAARALPGNWRSCATENRLDAATTDRIAACVEGPEGREMLRSSFEKAQQARVSSSPTIRLNGAPWRGGRDERAFLAGICDALSEPKPEPCRNIPPPPTVNLIVLGDRRCTDPECETTGRIAQLKNLFAGLVVTEQDWSTPEGKATFAEYGIQRLPAYIFDETVQADASGFQRIRRALRPTAKPGFQMLDVRARHDPNAEICNNGVDDTGDGKVDCDDETCRNGLLCRPEIKGSVQLFVMSQCPYGVQALDAMREVLDAFGEEITFDVHYIASVQGDGFRSLHGQPEVDEDIRALCAKKLLPRDNKYMNYIWCRNKDIRSTEWRDCATEAGLNLAAFEACATGEEGRRLLREDLAIAETLGFGASPTLLINNKNEGRGSDARAIQRAICQHNPDLRGCAATLSEPPPRPQGAGGGCGGGR